MSRRAREPAETGWFSRQAGAKAATLLEDVRLCKLIPKLPSFAFHYWDGFLGICFALAALVQGVASNNYALLLSGFGLLTFSTARKNWHYIGMIHHEAPEKGEDAHRIYRRQA